MNAKTGKYAEIRWPRMKVIIHVESIETERIGGWDMGAERSEENERTLLLKDIHLENVSNVNGSEYIINRSVRDEEIQIGYEGVSYTNERSAATPRRSLYPYDAYVTKGASRNSNEGWKKRIRRNIRF